jgi:hypothetical protein
MLKDPIKPTAMPWAFFARSREDAIALARRES